MDPTRVWPHEFPLIRPPRRKRPAGWQPVPGERVLYFRGGDHPMISVRLLHVPPSEGRLWAGWGRFLGEVSADRLYPLPGWEADRARLAREDEPESGPVIDGEGWVAF